MTTDVRINVGLPAHPKTKKLIRRLGTDAAWRLVCLMAWVAANRSDGDLSSLSGEDIEICVDWPGEEGAFIKCLVDVGFIDGEEGSYAMHDWEDHNPWAAGTDARSEKARWNALIKNHGREEAATRMPEYAARMNKKNVADPSSASISATSMRVAEPSSATSMRVAEPSSATSMHVAEPSSATSMHVAEPSSATSMHVAEPSSATSMHVAEPSSATSMLFSSPLFSSPSLLQKQESTPSGAPPETAPPERIEPTIADVSSAASPTLAAEDRPALIGTLLPAESRASGTKPPAAQISAEQAACRATWAAYSDAYQQRYGTAPVRNAKTNAEIKSFTRRIGADESPWVARYYLQHADSFYARKGHGVGPMLADAEKLRMEWATQRQVTGVTARQQERTGTMQSAIERIAAERGVTV